MLATEAAQATASAEQCTDDSTYNCGACWICLEDGTDNNPVYAPCSCPRYVHARCLATWQLTSAGKAEEKSCRFCFKELPGWKDTLTPQHLKPRLDQGTPVMAVIFNGKVYKIPVQAGPDGEREFRRKVQTLFNLPDTQSFDVTFECRTPMTGDRVQLKGFDCYDAATHLAAITAARRTDSASSSSPEAPTLNAGSTGYTVHGSDRSRSPPTATFFGSHMPGPAIAAGSFNTPPAASSAAAGRAAAGNASGVRRHSLPPAAAAAARSLLPANSSPLSRGLPAVRFATSGSGSFSSDLSALTPRHLAARRDQLDRDEPFGRKRGLKGYVKRAVSWLERKGS